MTILLQRAIPAIPLPHQMAPRSMLSPCSSALRRAVVRGLHSTAILRARLVDDSISLMRGAQQPPPPAPAAPAAKSVPRMSFTSPQLRQHVVRAVGAQAPSTISAIDRFFLRALEVKQAQQATASQASTLADLARQLRETDGRMLDIDLRYENEPLDSRRISTRESKPMMQLAADEQDGLVIIAHVVVGAKGAAAEEPVIELSSGFAIGTRKEGEGDMILSVAHTLHSASSKVSTDDPSLASAAFALTSSGHIYAIETVLSSFNAADLVVYRLAPEPLRDGKKTPTTDSPPRLRSLPVSPYPPPSGSPIACFAFTENSSAERMWLQGRIVEYKDQMGRSVETGTYDELSTMSCTVVPRSGSSGSPIIDVENGTVVGIMRGAVQGYGDRMRRGFATPAEKVFEMFRLPGFKSKAKVDASKETPVKISSE